MESEPPSDKETEHKSPPPGPDIAEPANFAIDREDGKGKGNYGPFFRKIGLEMIPVIAGVLIALFINNLREQNQDRRLLESTLESLTEEFATNRKNIETLLPRQQRFLDSLRHYMENRAHSIFDITVKTEGMGTPQIHATNWQASLNNNSLRLLNFATINLLSGIEAQYRELRDQETFMYPISYGPPMFRAGDEGWEYRKGIEQWMVSYMNNEKELIALYEKFQEIVETRQYRRGIKSQASAAQD